MPDTAVTALSEGVVVPSKPDVSNRDISTTATKQPNTFLSNGTEKPITNGLPKPTTNGTNNRDATPTLRKTPGYTPTRRLRVITIGAGFSGLILAHKLRYEHPEMSHLVDNTIYEARAEVGGTWLVNNYPGCQCDVPSHIYAFPFDPNPDWSRFYSTGPEIQAYILRTVQKWNLDHDIQLNTRVLGCVWQEELGQWKVTVSHNGTERDEYAEVVVSGQGFLNTWKWPDIKGLTTKFKGHKCHSAAWDHNYDYSNKRIAVIGNGSSGIQILPQMAKLPGTMVTSFARSPSWIVARLDPGKLLGKPGAGDNPAYTEAEKAEFRTRPEVHRAYRQQLVRQINKAFKMFVKGSPENIDIQNFARTQMRERLQNNEELCKKLIPDWELGCRRVTPGANYLESFLLPNVKLTQSPIVEVTEDSVVTEDGVRHEVDVVICATGFDVSHLPPYPIVGKNGISLADKWSPEPNSYLSVACPDMPNYFLFTGPNAVVGHGSLVEGLSWTADYMCAWFRKMATEDIKSVSPKQSVVDEFIRYGGEIHKTLVWTGGCRSWYKNNRVEGRVTATFPGSALLYKRILGGDAGVDGVGLRGEDFEIEYRGKGGRWEGIMGNGFLGLELDEEVDLAWYIKR